MLNYQFKNTHIRFGTFKRLETLCGGFGIYLDFLKIPKKKNQYDIRLQFKGQSSVGPYLNKIKSYLNDRNKKIKT